MSQELLRSRDRNKKVTHAFNASIVSKIISMGAGLISVPIAYKALGQEQFSLWMTITSIIAAMQFADLGIGNSLLNIVVIANARDDRLSARRAVTSSVGLLTLLCIFLLVFFICFYPFLNWTKIYNVSTRSIAMEAGLATAIMVLCLALNLPILTAQRVQMAYQDGLKANVWISIGSLFALAGIVTCGQMKANLVTFTFAALGGPCLAAILCWIYEFLIDRPWLFPNAQYFDFSTGRRLIKNGGLWSLFLLMGFIGTGLDNLIISHFFNHDAVAKYSVMSKLLAGLLVAQMLSAPLWPAFAEAIERGDLFWAQQTFRRSILICAAFGLLGAGIIVFMSHWVIELWVGVELAPDPVMVSGFALWCFVTNLFAGISAMMANHHLLPSLILLTTIATIISFILKILVAPSLGSDFIIWGTVIGYGLVCLPGIRIIHNLIK
jgi:O-antigen/teichoic acid export membrane protein